MDQDVRIGIVLPTAPTPRGTGGDPRPMVELARRAEGLGLDSVWVGDTLLRPTLDPLAVLAALAAVTDRLTLGTATLLPALRRPVQAARTIASVDLLSGGRLVVAVGAGFPGRSNREYAASDVPWARRFVRLDETVALWRRLWTGAGGDFHGSVVRYCDLPPGVATTRPEGPPIWLGGATATALARTGTRYDGWLPYPPDPTDYATGLAQITGAATAASRDPAAVTPALFVTTLLTEAVDGGLAELDDYTRLSYQMPYSVVASIQAFAAGTADQLGARLRSYLDAGARHLVCRIATHDPAAQAVQFQHLSTLAAGLRRSRSM